MESLPRNSSSNLSRNDMLNDDVDVRNHHEDVPSEQMNLAAIASQSYINYPPHCQIMGMSPAGGPPHGIEGQFQVNFFIEFQLNVYRIKNNYITARYFLTLYSRI